MWYCNNCCHILIQRFRSQLSNTAEPEEETPALSMWPLPTWIHHDAAHEGQTRNAASAATLKQIFISYSVHNDLVVLWFRAKKSTCHCGSNESCSSSWTPDVHGPDPGHPTDLQLCGFMKTVHENGLEFVVSINCSFTSLPIIHLQPQREICSSFKFSRMKANVFYDQISGNQNQNQVNRVFFSGNFDIDYFRFMPTISSLTSFYLLLESRFLFYFLFYAI